MLNWSGSVIRSSLVRSIKNNGSNKNHQNKGSSVETNIQFVIVTAEVDRESAAAFACNGHWVAILVPLVKMQQRCRAFV